MDINELIQELDQRGYRIIMQTFADDNIIIIIRDESPVAHILQNKLNEYYTGYNKFNALSIEEQEEITHLLNIFANTPVSVR